MKSNFSNDLKVESEVAKYVDKFLYPYIGDYFERKSTKEHQKKGIDLILKTEEEDMLIDDKCAIYYANKNLSTFTFELSYLLNDGSVRQGWLINSELSTTHYNVMWLNTKDKNINTKRISFNDIEDVEAMLISKQVLLTYLNSLGYDFDTLSNIDEEFRISNASRKRLTPHIELLISNHIPEKPVNLKINKTELSKLSEIHVKASENHLVNLKTDSVIETSKKQKVLQPAGLKAELEVFKAIKKYSAGHDCFPFLHFPLHKKGFQGRNEIDILVVDRVSGISVIEVKGITINQIESIQGGDWYYNDYHYPKGNPFKQAETQLNFLCKQVEEEPLLFRRFSKRAVIALPYITRSQWEEKGYHQLINSPPILFKDDLSSSEKIIQFESYYIYQADQPLDDNQWELMKRTFSIDSSNSLTASDLFSKLFVFPSYEFFERKEKDIISQLENGLRVTILCYFEIEEQWKKKFIDYEKNNQLQYFNCNKNPVIDETLEIEDGTHQLPDSILNDFKKFNYKQYEVVHAPYDENLMVTAGAGTGKTHVMIDRIMYLLTKGISLESIIMITFTNDSMNEMKKRLQEKLTNLSKLTGKIKYGMYAESVKDMQISTIHSFSKNILTSLAHEMGYGKNVQVRSFIQQKKQIIDGLIDKYYRENPQSASIHSLKHYELVNIIQKFWDEMEKKGLSKQEIKNLKWGKVEDDSYTYLHELFKFVFQHCEDRLDEEKKIKNAVSTNDLIRKIKDFTQDEVKMKQLQENKYLFIDEFQDSDNVQIDLVASLANYLNYKLFVVGDVKQSIYRFRGADYKSFDLLDKKVKKNEIEDSVFHHFSLNQNYRTASTLLDKMDNLFVKWSEKDWLANNEKLEGMNNRKESLHEFQFYGASFIKTKEAMIEAIRHSMVLTKSVPEDENQKIALIVRTNAQAKEVSKWCKEAKLNTVQNLDGTFYTSQAVRDFKSLLDGLLFPREAKYVLNTLQSPYFRYEIPYKVLLPFQGKSNLILSFIESKIGNDFNQYVNQLKVYPVMAVIQKIISEKALFLHLREFYQDKFESKGDLENFILKYKKNLFHLLNIIQQQFDMMSTTLYNIYQWITLQMRTNRTENEPILEAPKDSVEVTTVHRSKGLEYHTVIIPKTTNTFDFKRTTFYIEEEKNEQLKERRVAWFIKELDANSSYFEALEQVDSEEVYKEETRLLYVAMTRVEERLVVIMPEVTKKQTWADIIEQTGVKVVPYGR